MRRQSGTGIVYSAIDVKKWAAGIFDDGEESSNAIGKAPGTIQSKITALTGSLWAGQKIFAYIKAIINNDAGAAGNAATRVTLATPVMPAMLVMRALTR